MKTIVVGVDGSEGSKRALRWACDAASREDDATVMAIATWSYPVVAASPWMVGYDMPIDLSEPTTELLNETVAAMTATGFPADRIKTRVVCGSAASSLIDAAKDADLLVVGSRGLGGFAGLLLGSVSHQIAAHAPCPVVVVPPPADE